MPPTRFVQLAKREKYDAVARAKNRQNELIRSRLKEIFAENGSRRSKMLRMWAAGGTLKQIGQLFGVTRQRVQQVISPDYAHQLVVERKLERTLDQLRELWEMLPSPEQQRFLHAIETFAEQRRPRP
jgi:DNA-directed RNA polymerase sigma subunit (sigma70/sigma32)